MKEKILFPVNQVQNFIQIKPLQRRQTLMTLAIYRPFGRKEFHDHTSFCPDISSNLKQVKSAVEILYIQNESGNHHFHPLVMAPGADSSDSFVDRRIISIKEYLRKSFHFYKNLVYEN